MTGQRSVSALPYGPLRCLDGSMISDSIQCQITTIVSLHG